MDIHDTTVRPTYKERELMEGRMLAFIFPNEPTTKRQRSAFDDAVDAQLEHESGIRAQFGGETIPAGVTSISIGSFSVGFNPSEMAGGVLTRKTICHKAYALLLQGGLLYRGVRSSCDAY